MIPTDTTVLRGDKIILRAWCTSLCMNLAMGSNERKRYAWRDVLLWMHVSILVRLIRTGWAIQLLLITDMLVLSDDKTTPRRVVPGGSAS